MNNINKLISEIPIDSSKKRKALSNISQEVMKKTIVYRPSVWNICCNQARYISSSYWFSELTILIVLLLLCFQNEELVLKAKELFLYSSMIIASIGVIAVIELHRNISYHMAEIEQTCYLDLRQIWTMKMIMLGSINILAITLFAIYATAKTSYPFIAVCLYMMVPFVLSNFFYLLFFSLSRNSEKKVPQIALALFLGLAATIPSLIHKAYETNSIWIWTFILIIAILLLLAEIRYTMKQLSGGNEICWS